MFKKKLIHSTVLFTAAIFSACGDDPLNNSESFDVGDSVKTMEDLFNCTDKREGETAYVEEFSATYVCSRGTWVLEPKRYESMEDLFNCTSKRDGEIAYVEEKDKTYTCKDGTWVDENGLKSSSSGKGSSSSKKIESSSSESRSPVLPMLLGVAVAMLIRRNLLRVRRPAHQRAHQLAHQQVHQSAHQQVHRPVHQRYLVVVLSQVVLQNQVVQVMRFHLRLNFTKLEMEH